MLRLNIFTGFRVDFCKLLQVSGSILGGGWCRGACLRGNVQGARTQVFKMLEDPGSKLSSCDFTRSGAIMFRWPRREPSGSPLRG